MSKQDKAYIVSLAMIVVLSFSLTMVLLNPPSIHDLRRVDSSFHNVLDRPIIESLDKYYELIGTGKTTIMVDGKEHVIFLQDFTYDERERLQKQLRTP